MTGFESSSLVGPMGPLRGYFDRIVEAPVEVVLGEPLLRCATGSPFQIEASAEHARHSGQHRNFLRLVAIKSDERFEKGKRHLRVHRVARFRPIDRDDRDFPVLLPSDRHSAVPSSYSAERVSHFSS